MSKSAYITRKEIGNANELSHETIRRREHSLGLDQCKDKGCSSPVRYIRTTAESILKLKGMIAP